MVGSVIVHNGQIIGEGYHEYFGGPHAERNAIASVKHNDRSRIKESCIYVSLEPCNFKAKTPACSELILENKIPEVKISVLDPNPRVSGNSLSFLQRNGVKVASGICASEGENLIRPFKRHLQKKPYIILKWAQSRDNYISRKNERTQLSNPAVNRLVHKWRSESDAIVVGFNTAIIDNPQLTTRLFPGKNPVRIILDRDNTLPRHLHIWSDPYKSIFLTENSRNSNSKAIKEEVSIAFDTEFAERFCKLAFEKGLYRIIVEGGAKTLQSFIDWGLWDEARIIRSEKILGSGVRAPFINTEVQRMERFLDNDVLYLINRIQPGS